jgi:hypothetical protein
MAKKKKNEFEELASQEEVEGTLDEAQASHVDESEKKKSDESDVKKPELKGSKKPKFEQPGTNNQSREVIEE